VFRRIELLYLRFCLVVHLNVVKSLLRYKTNCVGMSIRRISGLRSCGESSLLKRSKYKLVYDLFPGEYRASCLYDSIEIRANVIELQGQMLRNANLSLWFWGGEGGRCATRATEQAQKRLAVCL
jgi:hypothetical protein